MSGNNDMSMESTGFCVLNLNDEKGECMSNVESLPSIGPVLAGRLSEAGITSVEELQQAGVKKAFLRVRSLYPDACLMSLYALTCAMQGKKRGMLTSEEKGELKAFFHSL